MKFDVVASGSKGNCTLVFSKGFCIQIDAGISRRRISNALKSYDMTTENVLAVLITHSHSDHCGQLKGYEEREVYASNPSLPHFERVLDHDHIVKPFHPFVVGPFTITPFPLSHDAKNTVGYLLDDGEEKFCYLTDTGFVPEKDFAYLKDLNYYVFESNHDPKMLYLSGRPDLLIKRIIGDKGHLSNENCGYYLSFLTGDHTKEVVLAHLSEECNTPELAKNTVERVLMKQLGYIPEFELKIASQDYETKGGL